MQKDRKRNSMESKLKEELEWYTLYASDEEYDEKAVESILYLLDRWEPLEEGTIPPVEESWKRFLAIADRKELLPVEDADVVLNAARKKEAAVQGAEQGEAAAVGQADLAEARRILTIRNAETDMDSVVVYGSCVTGEAGDTGKEAEGKTKPENAETGKVDAAGKVKAAGHGRIRKLAQFASRHKIIAAAVLVLMVLMVSNTVHVVAYPEAGFFFWMKRDDSGIKMITSPEGLDDTMDKIENIFYNEEDAPEWAKSWLKIEEGIELPENYEWKYFEANELDNRKDVVGYYWNDKLKKEIAIGVWIYADKISYGREKFIGYTYVQSYEISQVQIDIYNREEVTGKTYYIVTFYEGNSQYYIRGEDNLEELQVLIEEYCYSAKKLKVM